MAYTKRTCANCGWKGPQNEMKQITRRVEVARGRGTISGSTIVGALAGHKASSRKVGNAIFNTGQRTYSRKQTSWFCSDCASSHASTEGVAEFFKIVGGLVVVIPLAILFGSGSDDETSSPPARTSEAQIEVAADGPETRRRATEAHEGGLLSAEPEQAALGAGPSFDCTKAAQPSEHAICGSAVLSQLDLRLAASFKEVREAIPATVARDLGRDLLKDRQFCEADVSCLEVEMTRAIYQFEEMSRFAGSEMEAAFLSMSEQDRIRVQSNLGTTGHYTSGVDGLWGQGTSTAIYGRLVSELRERGSLEHKAGPAAALDDLANWR